ncbi:MAG TPA: SIS domain-containing protein [Terriglobia bacterium]|nr:SIS domain-containing protein [Terriglobia bacterium]
MGTRNQVQAIMSALALTLEKARAEYGTTLRKVRWGDGPIYVCGVGNYSALGLAAGLAFESFGGWHVVARPPEVFLNYSLSLLQSRSVLVLISPPGEWPEAQELAARAHERGGTVVAMANTMDSPLVKLADHAFLVRAEGAGDSPAIAVSMHAALHLLAFKVTQALKKPKPIWEQVDRDFDLLPGKLEWVFTQLSGVVDSLVEEAAHLPRLCLVGGGFNYYPVRHAAWRMHSLASPRVEEVEATEFSSAASHFARRGDAAFFVSGSHSKLKKTIHRAAAQARAQEVRVLSLTDSNDRELVEGSDLGILVPQLQEAPASTLALFLLEWLAMETLRTPQQVKPR